MLFCWAEITLFFHPYHVKFKQWICLNLIFEQSIVNGRDVKIKIWIGATNSIEPGQTAQVCRLAWLKSGAKALRVNPNKIYLHIIVWIVFLFCHMFQIKRLSSACSEWYLHRKSNTIFIQKAQHSLTGARVISTFSVRIETAAIVFNEGI